MTTIKDGRTRTSKWLNSRLRVWNCNAMQCNEHHGSRHAVQRWICQIFPRGGGRIEAPKAWAAIPGDEGTCPKYLDRREGGRLSRSTGCPPPLHSQTTFSLSMMHFHADMRTLKQRKSAGTYLRIKITIHPQSGNARQQGQPCADGVHRRKKSRVLESVERT